MTGTMTGANAEANAGTMTRLRWRPVPALFLLLLATGGLLSSLLAATPAFAYVRYRSLSNCPYSWRTRAIPITGFPQGLAGMTVEEITDAVTGAAAVWSKADPALAPCTDLDLKLTMQAVSVTPPAAKYDRRNNVVFRSDSWCLADKPTDCHESSALAITSVFAKSWGQIVDADIEVNGVNFIWADLVTSTAGTDGQDLQNALTHELGHLIGLDHTCSLEPSNPVPKDHTGQPVPDCGGASDSVRATTMFASADPGDISKRDLAPDDQQAVCDTYPLGAEDTLICPAPDSGGCEIASGTSTGGVWSIAERVACGGAVAVLALAALVGARRRSRR